MSDYMYLLDTLLSREQNQLSNEIQEVASELGVALYLTGGAMRDMLGGFPIRDIDFTFEGQPSSKLARLIEKRLPGIEIAEDSVRKIAELRLPSGATASLRMAHTQKVSKPGGTPKIAAASLLEDLNQRDFTINAIALSLAKASRGLIRDPANGAADLESRQIRAGYSQAFFDEPVRLLRAVRLKHRLGFQFEERTARYFNTAAEEGWIKELTATEWQKELRLLAEEMEPSAILRDLAESKLLPVPVETLNIEGLSRFEKLRRIIPGRGSYWPLFLSVLTEETKSKDRSVFATAFGLESNDLDEGKKVKPRATKLGEEVKSAALKKPSQIYNAISPSPNSDILYLLYQSDQPLVQARLREYFEKYLPEANEITDVQVEATGAKPGTAQFKKAKASLITAKLNAPPPPPPEPEPTGPRPPGGIGPNTRAVR